MVLIGGSVARISNLLNILFAEASLSSGISVIFFAHTLSSDLFHKFEGKVVFSADIMPILLRLALPKEISSTFEITLDFFGFSGRIVKTGLSSILLLSHLLVEIPSSL